MARITAGGQIELKLLYWGAPGSGKTTNLRQVYNLMRPEWRGAPPAETGSDASRSGLELLPVRMPLGDGYTMSARLALAPCAALVSSGASDATSEREAERRAALENTDAIIFVVDSRAEASAESEQSYRELAASLRALKLDAEKVPIAIQCNKRDLPRVRSMTALEAAWKGRGSGVFAASAVRGEGVLTTLEGALRLGFRELATKLPMVTTSGLDEQAFLARVLRNFERPVDLNAIYASLKDLARKPELAP